MARAIPCEDLVTSVRQAETIVDEALPLRYGSSTNGIADQTALRAAAMREILRELLDNEVSGLPPA